MSPPKRLVDTVERLVIEAVGITARALAEARASVDLSLIQWRVIVIVAASSEGVRVGTIARRSGMAVPSVSRLLRRLERRGLVTTQRDERDRRATIVRLTAAGVAVHSDVVRQRRESISAALGRGRAPSSPEVMRALEGITDALVAAGADPSGANPRPRRAGNTVRSTTDRGPVSDSIEDPVRESHG